jgi:hypothetical protein
MSSRGTPTLRIRSGQAPRGIPRAFGPRMTSWDGAGYRLVDFGAATTRVLRDGSRRLDRQRADILLCTMRRRRTAQRKRWTSESPPGSRASRGSRPVRASETSAASTDSTVAAAGGSSKDARSSAIARRVRSTPQKYTGTKQRASAAKSSRSSAVSNRSSGYVICLANRGYPAALEVGKLYRRLEPLPTDPKSRVRVVDESGEDYLYPSVFFQRIKLSGASLRALNRAIPAARVTPRVASPPAG